MQARNDNGKTASPPLQHEDENLFGTSTEEGSKRTKQEEGKEKKRVRNAQLRSLTCCLDSRGSHREPCHVMAYGNRPANTHLFDGYMYPCDAGNGSSVEARH